ncbi:MAG: hypothetical protein ACI9JN_002405 [Bacteroidia bacterium]|jgi:hypothetical protein
MFILAPAGYAQTDTLDQYYSVDFNQDIDKFEREHDQLDAKKVKIIPYRQGAFYGFVEPGKPDKFIIKPRFEQVYGVYEHGAIVKDTNYGYGLIDYKGAYLISPNFSNLYKEGNTFHGSFYSQVDSTYGLSDSYNSCFVHYYFDLSGNLLFSEVTHEFEGFTAGDSLAQFRFGRTIHIRSNTGRLVKSFKLDSTYEFVGISNNLIVTMSLPDSNWNYTYTAKTADDVTEFSITLDHGSLKGVYKLGGNHFGLLGRHGDYFFADSNGVSTGYGSYSNSIGMITSYAEFFTQNQFIVKNQETKLYGVVDRAGKAITAFKYSRIFPFINNSCFAKINSEIVNINGRRTETNKDSKVVIIDTEGNERLYTGMYPDVEQYQTLMTPPGFYDGLLLTKDFTLMYDENDTLKLHPYHDLDSMHYVFVDESGQVQITLPNSIVFVGVFSEGLAAAVNKDRQLGFINKKGEWAIAPEFELTLAGAYPMPYLITPQFLGGYAYIKSHKGYIDKKGNKYFDGKRMQDRYNFSH